MSKRVNLRAQTAYANIRRRRRMGGNAVPAWKAQVVANGGASPSPATVQALTTFWNGVTLANLATRVKLLNAFVSDSLIAACTPLVPGKGLLLWTNHNFIAGDLTVNGLKGNGSTKFLSTGFSPATALSKRGGLILYNIDNVDGTEQDMGSLDGVLGNPVEHAAFQMHISVGGSFIGDCFSDGTGRINVGNSGWTGYTSLHRISGTSISAYTANSSSPHSPLDFQATDNSAWSAPVRAMTVFCGTASDSPQFSFSSKRLSFAAVVDGFTEEEDSDFFDLVQQLRVNLLGGFV